MLGSFCLLRSCTVVHSARTIHDVKLCIQKVPLGTSIIFLGRLRAFEKLIKSHRAWTESRPDGTRVSRPCTRRAEPGRDEGTVREKSSQRAKPKDERRKRREEKRREERGLPVMDRPISAARWSTPNSALIRTRHR